MGYLRPRLGSTGSLPSVLIIGGQRCGTTVLHSHLTAHPQVRSAYLKEVHYFTFHHDRGPDWYRSQFPSLAKGEHALDASPLYIFEPAVAARVHDLIPDVRIIAMLRNPIDRALSHFRHNKDEGIESLSLAEALAAEPERLAEADALGGRAGMKLRQRSSYLARGRYAEQLLRWYDVFPREQLHVIRSEDFFRNTEETFSGALTFLDLAPAPLRPHTLPNTTKSGDHLPTPLREQMQDYFAEPNRQLETLLGWPASWNR